MVNEDQIRATLEACEASMRAGERIDLKGTGFWKAVGAVKRNPAWVDAYADRIGTIDGAAFRAAKQTFPMVAGTTVLIAGTLAGFGLILAAYYTDPPWNGLLLLAGMGAHLGTLHGLAHVAVGAAFGMRFTGWFFSGPFRIQPGVKTDYASYLRTPPRRRAWMHASGAIATKLVPFLALGAAWGSGVPGWTIAVILVLGVVMIITDVVFSRTQSDWKYYLREMRIARTVGA